MQRAEGVEGEREMLVERGKSEKCARLEEEENRREELTERTD